MNVLVILFFNRGLSYVCVNVSFYLFQTYLLSSASDYLIMSYVTLCM